MSGAYVDVALPLALAGPLTYAVPDDLLARAVPGARVVVPVREKEMVGIVTAADRPAPPAAARPVLAAPDPAPLLDASLLALADWMASHYAAPPGLVLRAMLPAALFSEGRPIVRLIGDADPGTGAAARLFGRRSAVALAQVRREAGQAGLRHVARLVAEGAAEVVTLSPRPDAPEKRERVYAIVEAALPLMERERRFTRAPRQREAYEVLEGLGGRAAAAQLAQAGVSPVALRALALAGLVETGSERRERDPFAALPVSLPPGPVTAQQAEALAALEGLAPGGVALLFGVTGSGKTLV